MSSAADVSDHMRSPRSPNAAVAPPVSITRWKYIALFCTIAFSISWLLWVPATLGKDGLGWLSIDLFMPLIVSIGTIGPLIAAFLTHRIETGSWHAVHFLPKRKIHLLWLILGPGLILFCYFIVFAALISEGSPRTWHWHPIALAEIVVPMFNYNLFGGPLFEEFGWRGFLQPRLQQLLPPWIAAITVGVIWSAWHMPLFLIHGWTTASFSAFVAIFIGLSSIMAFAFNSSGQMIVVAILMHAAFNSSGRVVGAYLNGTATRQHWDFFGLAAFLLVGLTLAILTRGRLASDRLEPVAASTQ